MPRTKQFDKTEVLNKAMELFWEKGFHATSIQDLVAHLGINRASLYDTFGGKDQLFESAFELYREKSGNFLHSTLADSDSVKDGFRKLFEIAIQEAIDDPAKKGCFVVNVTTELVPGNDKIQEVLCANKDKAEQLFLSLIEKGIANGEIPAGKDPKAIASYLFTLYSGLRVVGKVDANQEHLEQIVATGLKVLD